MKKFLLNKPSKAVIDILLIIGIYISVSSSRPESSAAWTSFHAISSMVWYALMLVHIWQHWALTKALVKQKIITRNKITFMTLVVFLLMSFTVILFIFEVSEQTIRFHNVISRVFWIVMIIHTIQKSKRFVQLFKKKKQTVKNKTFAAA